MKILHTSDWHISKQLHKIDLSEDIEMFFDWLIKKIDDESIDLLLISGDIFDQANPSQAALKQYYGFLKRMIGKECKVLITGGNHDSPSVLNAPKEILSYLDIQIVGGAPKDISELFFEYQTKDKNVVVAAVPYLKDKDIRNAVAGENYSDKIEQIRNGLNRYFKEINTHYNTHYQNYKFIVMGHLFVQGSELYKSDSMRDIQIGNQASVNAEIFGTEPNYVALGHIHKPYAVSKSKNIYYCGSPVSLSFSEKEDIKQINIVEFTQNATHVSIVEIPKFRTLISFQGSLTEVYKMITEFKNTSSLQALGEIVVNEENESISIRQGLEDLITQHDNKEIQVIKSRLNFSNKIGGVSKAFETGTDVTDVTPMEMFEKRIQFEGDLEDTDTLKNAFREILEQLNL